MPKREQKWLELEPGGGYMAAKMWLTEVNLPQCPPRGNPRTGLGTKAWGAWAPRYPILVLQG